MKIQFQRQALVAVWLLAGLPVAAAVPPEPGSTSPQAAGESASPQTARKIVREGIGIELEMEAVAADQRGREFREGDAVTFRFHITDTNTQTPLSGVFPAAWMDLRPDGEAKDPVSCKEKVEAFIGGSLFAPPELDLNVYYVLALNNDATVSVVDPLFGFGTTKLLDMIFLESPGEDWELSADQLTLYVAMPDVSKVAVASTATWKVTTNLSVGPRPSRVALQADGRYLWVGYDALRYGLSGVTVIDTTGPRVAKDVTTGTGTHEIAFSADDRYAFVTNSDDGKLSIIDVGTLEKVKDVAVGHEPVSLAYSPVADAVYVVSRGDGTIVAVDGKSHEVVARLTAGPGLGQIKFEPGGRFGFIVYPEKNQVLLLDAATHRIIQTVDVEEGPDQIAFSDHLAYVRHSASETVLMIPLEQIGHEGAPVPVIDFPGGQTPFGRGGKPSPADGIVQAPGATAVLVANPADKAIYFYKEGMAAPMGHFQNYGREPRAVLAVDRSLEERTPGSYETTATLRRPGVYDVAFFLDSPRTVHCFPVTVAPNPELVAERAREMPVVVQPILDDLDVGPGGKVKVAVGEKTTLRFKLTDVTTGEPHSGLADVRILTFRAPGLDQQRRDAEQVGDGVYQIEIRPTQAGIYYAFVECASIGLGYNESAPLVLDAEDGSAGEVAHNHSEVQP